MSEVLRGRRILVTRPAHQAESLCAALERAGAVPVRLPLLRIAPTERSARDVPLDAADYDWVAFTSANGVAHAAALFGQPLSSALGLHRGVAAVGPATARALADADVSVALVADTHVAESLADALGDVRGRRVLWPRAMDAREVLATRLRARGAHVDDVVVYRSVPAALPIDAAERVRGVHAVSFASPSAVRAFVDAFGVDPSGDTEPLGGTRGPLVACIGPVTEAAARALGVRVDAVADPCTVHGLVHALERALDHVAHEAA